MDLPFPVGKTFYDGGTVDTTAGIFDHILGKEFCWLDQDIDGRDSSTNTKMAVKRIPVRNDSGSAISNAAGLCVKFGTDSKDHLRLSDGLVSLDGQFGLPVDSCLPTTWDIADDDVFWVISEGPAECVASAAIAVDDLVTTVGTSGKIAKFTGQGVPLGVATEAATTDGDRITVLVGKEYFGNPGQVAGATFSIGAEDTNAITVSIQLKDSFGRDLTGRAAVVAYVSDSATGDSAMGASGSISGAVGTDGVVIELSTDNCFLLISESDGDIDFVLTDSTGAATHYLFLVMPNGNILSSGAITFAA